MSPAAPGGLTASEVFNRDAKLAWQAVSGATSYTLKRGPGGTGSFTVVKDGITGTSYTDATLSEGTKYYFVVSAVNADGESPNSAPIQITTRTNWALNRAVTASSSENSTNTPNKAVDGILSTRWSSNYADPAWIQVDLGGTYLLDSCRIHWETAYSRAFELQGSTNGTDWTTLYTTTTNNGGVQTLTGLPSMIAQYMRIYSTQRATQWGHSIWELELFGTSTTVAMSDSNVSWLNAMWGLPASEPMGGIDYVLSYVGVTNPGLVYVSPKETAGHGDTAFPGQSITVPDQCRLQMRQYGGESVTINGGAGSLYLTNGGRLSTAGDTPVPPATQPVAFNLRQLDVSGSVLFDNSDCAAGLIINGGLTGTGNISVEKLSGHADRFYYQFNDVKDYRGTITLHAYNDLAFGSDTVFKGGVTLVGTGADSPRLKISRQVQFLTGKLVVNGITVADGTYSGTALDALNTSLGGPYLLNEGGILIVQPPLYVETYHNPVIPGFYPDPSICRVGDDYYLVNSTFEYFPGVPIFHSKDLVHWKQIGHCLTRNSQLPLGQCGPSGGIYAPTIRYHNGTFYLVVTNYASGGNAIFTATDPAGPWSEPIWLGDWNCDPSLLFDATGTIYYTAGSGSKIYQSVYDPVAKKINKPLQTVFETGFAEAPHLYPINGMYYLMLAEGGTGYGHNVTIARSSSPWGPFEDYSGNPILTHKDLPNHPIQATGHGDLVQTPDGDWWIVFLGTRPKGGKYTHLGRETFLAPVEWNASGWPVVNQTGRVQLEMEGTGLVSHPWPEEPLRDEFVGTTLKFAWNYLRNPIPSNYSLSARPGYLRLKGTEVTLNETKSPTFTGQRQTLFECRAKTRLEFNPAVNHEEAGLVVLGNNKNHFDLGITRLNGKRCIFMRKRQSAEDKEFISREIPNGPVELSVVARDLSYTFCYQVDGEPLKVLSTAETKLLSCEVIGGFTGTYIGIYATGNGSICTVAADFDWFEITPGTGETLPSPVIDAGDNILLSMEMLPAKITGLINDPEHDLAAITWTLLTDDSAYPGQPSAAAMQMWNRNAFGDPNYTNLLQDWIGTDTREIGDPLVLTISGLPAGTYTWTSYHHDTQDQTGQFDLTIYDADTPETIFNNDITNGALVPFSNVRKVTVTIVSNGSAVSLVFDQRPHTSVANKFFVMNGFNLVSGSNAMKVDFGTSDSPVQNGYAAYTAKNENFSSFTPQTFSAFGTTVTVNPDWRQAAVAASLSDTTKDFYKPTASFTTETVGTYKIRLSAADANLNPGIPDMMEIRVYADACGAANNNPNGPYVPPVYDFNGDCKENLTDWSRFASLWLTNKTLPDLIIFASQWLENSGQAFFSSPVIYSPMIQP